MPVQVPLEDRFRMVSQSYDCVASIVGDSELDATHLNCPLDVLPSLMLGVQSQVGLVLIAPWTNGRWLQGCHRYEASSALALNLPDICRAVDLVGCCGHLMLPVAAYREPPGGGMPSCLQIVRASG